MIAQDIDITVNYLIERRTRVYGRLKIIYCNINRQVRARYIRELFGLDIQFLKQILCIFSLVHVLAVITAFQGFSR